MTKPASPASTILSAQIPYSQEAEEAVIGAVLVNPDALLAIASFLKPNDFYIVRHAYVWEALLAISERNESIDYLTLQEELRTRNRLSEVGGPAYLTQLVNAMPTSMHAGDYGRLVWRAALRRKLLVASDEIRQLAFDESTDYESAFAEAMRKVERAQPQERQHFLPGSRSVAYYAEVMDDLIARQQNGEMIGYPLPAQWSSLAEAVPMVFPGDFVVVSGAPGSGKSAMLETWAEWCAALPAPVHYIHTEMNTDQLLHRRMSRHSGIAYHRLASGTVNDWALIPVDDRIRRFASNVDYHWMPDVRFDQLAPEMRRAAKAGVKVFFVDHFQDIQPIVPNGGNEIRGFESMCVWFAAFAEKNRVVVVMASQQNDAGKTKWTRKLVEKAVTWFSIRRPRLKAEYAYLYDGVEFRCQPGEDAPESEVVVNKARFGKKTKLKMLYHGPRFTWLDMSAIRKAQPDGKVISLDDLKARHQAAREVAQ